MPNVGDQIRAKITRAKQNFEDLQLAIEAFYTTNPYGVAVKEDPDSRKRIFYIAKADPVPLEIATIAADYCKISGARSIKLRTNSY